MPRLLPPHLPAGSLAAHDQPTIIAGPVTLRPFETGDAPWLVEVYLDADIQRWHLARFDSVREAEDWIGQENHAWRAETDATWLVADSSTGAPLGRVSLRSIELGWGCAEISYWVAADARRGGVARAALVALTGWATNDLGLQRLVVSHSTHNGASCAVVSGAGYSSEGTSRFGKRHLDGWHDMHLHAFVAGDSLPSHTN